MEKVKILVIDKNEDNIIVLSSLITKAFPQATLKSACSGKLGIETCIAEKPDVILLHMGMPETNGYPICKILKEDKKTQHIPIVMLSVDRDDKESRMRALEIGVDAFLMMPLDESEFTAQIRTMLRIKELEDRKLAEKERLEELVKELKKQNKLVEAERIEQRTNYDLEMLQEVGFCHGIENYSRQLEFRNTGDAPFSLVDYFNYFNPDGSLIFIDESHISVSQIRAMAIQDKVRKGTLIDFGFRLPSAIDNRPLNFQEFQERQKQTIYVSATPADYEKNKSGKNIIEQIIRPTGLLEPKIEIRKTENQIKDLIEEVKKQIDKKERTLVVTLTKRLAEEITDYLVERGIKTQYLHSEVKTMERPKILKEFREGKYDVLVGINLLREGIDLPEVSLIAILDADKEGFLRSRTSLIQNMGSAARNVDAEVLMYADVVTGSMQAAMDEMAAQRRFPILG